MGIEGHVCSLPYYIHFQTLGNVLKLFLLHMDYDLVNVQTLSDRESVWKTHSIND